MVNGEWWRIKMWLFLLSVVFDGKFYATLYTGSSRNRKHKEFWSNVLEEVRQMESNAHVHGLALYMTGKFIHSNIWEVGIDWCRWVCIFSDGNFSKFSVTSYILSMKKGVKSATEWGYGRRCWRFKERGEHMRWLSKIMKE